MMILSLSLSLLCSITELLLDLGVNMEYSNKAGKTRYIWRPNMDMWLGTMGVRHSKTLKWHCQRTYNYREGRGEKDLYSLAAALIYSYV